LIQVKRTKKGREKPKVTLIEVVKMDLSFKEVMESMTFDGIE
jgi:hypothetical protein